MTLSQRAAPSLSMRWFFLFFFVSGFCSLLYEVVWLRLAMAKFGVTSPLLSIVLSMFMAGLGLGSWASGRLIRNYRDRMEPHALRLYALAELLIGASALLVPREFAGGRGLVGQFSLSSSAVYYMACGAWIGLTLIPWSACMGATIPFAMLAIRSRVPAEAQRSFSFLYLANGLGAFLGALGPAVLVELYGFRGALRIGAGLNALLALTALGLASRVKALTVRTEDPELSGELQGRAPRGLLTLLFATGCTSMGVEVVWVREFTPYVGTVVYAFALLLALYLIFTYLGSRIYRRWSLRDFELAPIVWAALGWCGVLAAVTADPQIPLPRALRLIFGIMPLSGMMGFVTPALVDQWSKGNAHKAGSAYAVNVVGCIVGPLLSGFLFLPYLAERWVLLIFSLPWLVLGVVSQQRTVGSSETMGRRTGRYVLVCMAVITVCISRGYEGRFAHHEIRRDNTATVIAVGSGIDRQLLVNGVGITRLTPTTKMMAHLPLGFLPHAPQNALVVCFGMGTSFRSLLSWKIPVTAVELVPSVPKLFWYFHDDAQAVLSSPLSRVVIDDGRAYLERTTEQFDVITIDPPPPVEAAGSSLLYSTEFYGTIRRRLRPGGILQQWMPKDDNFLQAAMGRALAESFPYVRVFDPMMGTGLHFLASDQAIPQRSAAEITARMPPTAVDDLAEWGPEPTAEKNLALILSKEHSIDEILARDERAPALEDDRPVNEFYVLRRYVTPGLRRVLAAPRR